jgi:serine protease Do
MGDSDNIKIGNQIVSISSSLGQRNAVVDGMISAILNEMFGKYKNEIQSTIKGVPGSSGGGLFDMNGELIGIIFSGFTEEEDGMDAGFAIPINEVKKLLEELN